MSTSPNTNEQLAIQESNLQRALELDKFAAENSVTTLLAGEAGAFTVSMRMSAAMEQLRAMITPEMMKPIMAMQGSSLGFRTDKDKEGGYKADVVKEVLIEATLKGFRMVNNETNIIAGRFYAARDGFERIFRDLGKTGRVTNLELTPGNPKTQADGSLVDYHASWTFKTDAGDLIKDELKLSLPVKVNAGQGADAILGKAKRKMLAAIYARITGTTIVDGEADDSKTTDVSATVVPEKPAAGLPADLLAQLEEKVSPYEAAANTFLIGNGSIQKGQTFRNVPEPMARKILKQLPSFLDNIAGK